MTIQTIYDLNEKVFYLANNKIVLGKVGAINIQCTEDPQRICYRVDPIAGNTDKQWLEENALFSSKTEVTEFLLTQLEEECSKK